MAGLTKRTPAREIVAREISPHIVGRECELICVQGAVEQFDALRSVTVGADAVGVTPSRRTGDDHCSLGFAPTLAATELDALRHGRIMSG